MTLYTLLIAGIGDEPAFHAFLKILSTKARIVKKSFTEKYTTHTHIVGYMTFRNLEDKWG
jgi:hypothetical protein